MELLEYELSFVSQGQTQNAMHKCQERVHA